MSLSWSPSAASESVLPVFPLRPFLLFMFSARSSDWSDDYCIYPIQPLRCPRNVNYAILKATLYGRIRSVMSHCIYHTARFGSLDCVYKGFKKALFHQSQKQYHSGLCRIDVIENALQCLWHGHLGAWQAVLSPLLCVYNTLWATFLLVCPPYTQA